MKSSSQLFPVELVSAEVRDTYFEDSYSIKHNRSSDKSVEIALVHLHALKNPIGKQVLFVHDVFQSHWQWTQGQLQETIDKLLSDGFSLWFMDWRCHGSSKQNKHVELNHIDEMAEHDLTSVIEFIQEIGHKGLTVVSSGFGSQMVLSSIGSHKNIDRQIMIDAVSILGKRRFLIPGFMISRRLNLFGRDWIEGIGPEHEPVQLFKKHLKRSGWLSLFKLKRRHQQLDAIIHAAPTINWLCTKRGPERTAKRLTKKQARVHRISSSQVASELRKLISA